MKKLILFFLAILMSLIGCRTSKESTSKTDSNIQTDLNVSKAIDAQKSLALKVDSLFTQVSSFQKFINQLEQKKESESKQEIDYDTSKPVIPETGKPPVLRETNYNKNTESSKQLSSTEITNITTQIQKKLEARIDSLYKSKFDSIAAENKKIKAELSDIVKMGRSTFESMCIWFTVIVLLSISIYSGIKYRQQIMSFFRKIFFKM